MNVLKKVKKSSPPTRSEAPDTSSLGGGGGGGGGGVSGDFSRGQCFCNAVLHVALGATSCSLHCGNKF